MRKREILLSLCLVSFAGTVRAGDETRFSLVLYSGREDPAWKGSVEDVETFAARFDGLKSQGAKELPPGALGYRGFLVGGFRSYDRVRVWGGVVEATRGGESVRWEDKGRALEKALLEMARPHVSTDEYQAASAGIGEK